MIIFLWFIEEKFILLLFQYYEKTLNNLKEKLKNSREKLKNSREKLKNSREKLKKESKKIPKRGGDVNVSDFYGIGHIESEIENLYLQISEDIILICTIVLPNIEKQIEPYYPKIETKEEKLKKKN